MDVVLAGTLALIVGLVLAGFASDRVWRGRLAASQATHAAEIADLRRTDSEAIAELRHCESAARAEVERDLAAAQASVSALRESLESSQQQYREAAERHRREAADREKAGAGESKVLQQLSPVTAQLRAMQQKVDEIEKQRSQQHGQLSAQLKVSQESAEKSRQAAEALSSALRNNSVRGAYGETQLMSLVESAGLLKRIDYSVQERISADSGARRPDMIITLPGRKQMAIDAKVPFSAFIESHETSDEQHRATLQAQHAKQVKAHVDKLSEKEYWTGLELSPEFTIAFIPSDAILNVALDADPGLMEYAFGRGIILATPVNLWGLLKTIAYTWQQEDLAEHAQDVVSLGRDLYKRLGTLSTHIAKLGRSLDRSVADYNSFVGSLERKVLVTARKLDGFDESLLEATPGIESDSRVLTAPELTGPATELSDALFDVDRPEVDASVPRELYDERDAG